MVLAIMLLIAGAFPGIYSPEDPPPTDTNAAMAELAALKPASAKLVEVGGYTKLSLDGEIVPANAYKGTADYKLIGAAGGRLIITHCRGERLYRPTTFEGACHDPKIDQFDFSMIEKTLLRIWNADKRLRVILTVNPDPHRDWLSAHPDSIFLAPDGKRGRIKTGALLGYGDEPLDSDPRYNWAWSYTSKDWVKYADRAMVALCEWLKCSPVGNLVVGFHLAGGMDGQFVQWEYEWKNGNFDYSEANRRALCAYLKSIYGTDEVLQQAWGDPKVTLATAANPTMAEWVSERTYTDCPGLDRKVSDCRRFVTFGQARVLNHFAKTLKRAFGRDCVVVSWYTSSIWPEAGRLSIDELVKDGGVDIINTVSQYREMRKIGGIGACGNNLIAGLNHRKLLFLQEMDHRSWRSALNDDLGAVAVAAPKNLAEFRAQIYRDCGTVLALGGGGWNYYDMFGSWYHDDTIKDVFTHCYAMNAFATKNAGKYARPEVAIFGDEKARIVKARAWDGINENWRTSGVTPDLYYLEDLQDVNLPQYKLYIFSGPVTLGSKEVATLEKAMRNGAKVAFFGDVATSSDLKGVDEVLKRLPDGVIYDPALEHLKPQKIYELALRAKAHVWSMPGNAVAVGCGVASVHRIGPEAVIDFGREVTLVDPVKGDIIEKTSIWKPAIAVGESAAVCYLP